MKRTLKLAALLICVLIITPSFTPAVFANSAEPPALTVIVQFPPDDLILSIRLTENSAADGSEAEAVELHKAKKVRESYYRFYYLEIIYYKNKC